MLCLRLA